MFFILIYYIFIIFAMKSDFSVLFTMKEFRLFEIVCTPPRMEETA